MYSEDNELNFAALKAKKEQKKQRLQNKNAIIYQIKENLSRHSSPPTPESSFVLLTRRAALYPRGSKQWAHALLELEENCPYEQARKHYLEKVKIWHPDGNPHMPEEAMVLLNEAWESFKRSAQQGK